MPNRENTLITGYLKKWPNLPCLTLSKKIYAENKDVFIDIEQVRHFVRYYRGRHGNYQRKFLADKSIMENYKPIFEIPQAYEEGWDPFYISKAYHNILILSDIHIPYHDTDVIRLAVEWGKHHEIDCILLNGDIVDFYGISAWGHDPLRPTTKMELDMLHEFLQWLHQELPVKIYYKDGNHEERILHYLRRKSPELYDVLEYRKEKLYDYAGLNIECIGEQRMAMIGKLTVLHGHELKLKSVAVNPARSVFLKTFQSCLVGDRHQVSEHTEPNLKGEILTTWSTGCLCQLHPEYARINRWSHGFARVKVEDSGSYKVNNIRIHNGEVL